MKRVLLVSLLSDQTLPNVQIIKEYKSIVTDYLFVSTKSMEAKGVCQWIKDAADIRHFPNIITKVVEEYNQIDIVNKLNEIDYSIFDKIVFNLTGGTKIMILASYDYYKTMEAEIIYVTGKKSTYLTLLPEYKSADLSSQITLDEYLKAYGFTIQMSSNKAKAVLPPNEMLNKYCEGTFDLFPETLKFLRDKRNSGVKSKDFAKVQPMLEALGVEVSDMCLSADDVKYLTGEWFEEYIGERVKIDLNIDDCNIKIGTKIFKETSFEKPLNSIIDLLGVDDSEQSSNNEFDVMFMYKGKFHVIECKTSIIDYRLEIKTKKNKAGKSVLDMDGKPIQETKYKPVNILHDTIYKSDALKNKFGLFAQSYIFTLTDFKQYIQNDNNRTNQMTDLLNRASISKIKVVDRNQIVNAKSIKELL